jgi:hypothetical protein
LPFTGDFAWTNKQQQGTRKYNPGFDDNLTLSNPSPSSITLSKTRHNQFSSILSRLGLESYGSEHCLLLLDVRNAWPNPLSVSLQVSETVIPVHHHGPLDSVNNINENLQPGHISRFILVLPRIFIENPHAAIPALNTGTKRQFVVSANKLTFEAEAAGRETFWYREELLKRIRGTWREEGSGREGDIDLRSVRLNPRMVDSMRMEDVDVLFFISPTHQEGGSSSREENTVSQTGRSKFSIKTNAFLKLVVTIHNRSSKPIHPLLRLQPSLRNQPHNVALDLSRRLAWTGMLQRVLPVLGAGEITQSSLGVTVFCRGEYEIGASVEEVRLMRPPPSPQSDTDGGKMSSRQPENDDTIEDTFGTNVTKQRRIWHSREACMVSAAD